METDLAKLEILREKLEYRATGAEALVKKYEKVIRDAWHECAEGRVHGLHLAEAIDQVEEFEAYRDAISDMLKD